jgi:hypothetical protein
MFLVAVEGSLALLGLRAFVVRRFPNYMIFHLPSDDAVTVLRVRHGARDLAKLFDSGAAPD